MSMHGVQKGFVAFFALVVLLWLGLYVTGTTEGTWNFVYSFVFGLIPFFAGLIMMFRAKAWGGMKTALGKAVFFIGLGIFLWGCGENIWSYYNFFLNEAAPYPSLADIGFAPSIFFYGLGAYYLSKVSGAKYGLRSTGAKVGVGIGLAVLAAFSYYVLIVLARGGIIIPAEETTLKAVLDIAYPLGDFVALAIAAIVSGLSFQYLGGRHKYDIMAVLAGLIFMFVADTLFSYTTTAGTYYNANFGDLLLATGMFLLSYGVLGFYKVKEA